MSGVSNRDVETIAADGYVYLYPLVMMDVTRRQMTNAESGARVGFGPTNTFTHLRAFPPPEFRAVPWANFDTLYSMVWLDLTNEPQILSVPDMGDRYYLLPMQDMWTDVFAVPGKRTTGTGAGHFAVVPPDWHGDLPTETTRVRATTPYAWLIGRTQTNGADDYPAVRTLQDGFTVTPLSRWGQQSELATVHVDATIDMTTQPVEQVNRMSAVAYFGYAAELMKLHPPHATDWSILARLRHVGFEPGEAFSVESLDPSIGQALDAAVSAGQRAIAAKIPTLGTLINGWQVSAETMGVYGNYYLKRAALAMIGLGSNPPEDAIYPLAFADRDGGGLSGEHRYVLHFDKPELPPVGAFWSVTVYDREGFQVPNALSRSALGDRDALQFNGDGSLELVIQHDNPGPEQEANWLPAPDGPFALFLRLYEPMPEVLDGRWRPPGVRRTP